MSARVKARSSHVKIYVDFLPEMNSLLSAPTTVVGGGTLNVQVSFNFDFVPNDVLSGSIISSIDDSARGKTG